MSNEYKDWLRDQAEEAKEWVAKYPFLRIQDNSCCPWENTDEIESCWMFDLPIGWYDIGAQMCDELMAALGKYADDFLILQMKEKYNEIRLYWRWADREYTKEENAEMRVIRYNIDEIIEKYEEISYNTCTACGKPATKWTKHGWFASFCGNCYERMNKRD